MFPNIQPSQLKKRNESLLSIDFYIFKINTNNKLNKRSKKSLKYIEIVIKHIGEKALKNPTKNSFMNNKNI